MNNIAGRYTEPWFRTVGLLILCLLLYLPGQMSIPPVDRDESRFAQATRQMVESGDYVDIRFQAQPRYNKPVGIYWLQAASVRLTGAASDIWAYRVPSWLGATLAVIVTGNLAARLFGPGVGALAGILLATSLLLGVEARLAKTDAVLLSCIVVAQSVLAWLYLERALSLAAALLFWVALGAGILIKGPIILLVVVSTALVLAIFERSARWMSPLRPVSGSALLLLIMSPWLVAITLKSHGAFWRESLGNDLLAKISGVQESHGGPPGYYLCMSAVTFWPWAFLLLPGLRFAWLQRQSASVRFCLAWSGPTWLFFELLPTKLLHYTLPIFPAFAALMAASVLKLDWPTWLRRITIWQAILLLGIPAVGIPLAIYPVQVTLFPVAVASGLLTIAAALIGWGIRRRNPMIGAGIGLSALVISYGVCCGVLIPQIDPIWLSRGAAALVAKHNAGCNASLVVVGYNEPSLVFLAGSSTVLEPDGPAGLVDAEYRMRDMPCTLLLIDEASRSRLTLPVVELGRVAGINYTKGIHVDLVLVRRIPGPEALSEPTADPAAVELRKP